MVHFSELNKSTIVGDANTCSICFEDYQSEDEVVVTKCHHLFHTHCREEWRRSLSGERCPLCQTRDIKVLTKDELPHVKELEVIITEAGTLANVVLNPQHLAVEIKEKTHLSDEESFDLAKAVVDLVENSVIQAGGAGKDVILMLRERAKDILTNFFSREGVDSSIRGDAELVVDHYLNGFSDKLTQTVLQKLSCRKEVEVALNEEGMVYNIFLNPRQLTAEIKGKTNLSEEESFELAKRLTELSQTAFFEAAQTKRAVTPVLEEKTKNLLESFFSRSDVDSSVRSDLEVVVDQYVNKVPGKIFLAQFEGAKNFRQGFHLCKNIAKGFFDSLPLKGKLAVSAAGLLYTGFEVMRSYYALQTAYNAIEGMF